MKVALCVCGRLGNRYVSEYVKHYKNLGFDHIYIGDNNRDGEENFKDVLQSDIDENFVTLYDYSHLTAFTDLIYTYFTDMYNKLSNEYDWIAFFDIDEFLIFEKAKTISEFIESNPKFSNYDIIRFPWKVYTDGDIVRVTNGNYSVKRFTKTYKDNDEFWNSYKTDAFCKSIIRCSNPNITRVAAHGCYQLNIACGPDGNRCNNKNCRIGYPFRESNAWLNHYWTKTLEEYIETKYRRGDPTTDVNKYTNMDFFFTINKRTKEKVEYLKNKGIIV